MHIDYSYTNPVPGHLLEAAVEPGVVGAICGPAYTACYREVEYGGCQYRIGVSIFPTGDTEAQQHERDHYTHNNFCEGQ